MKILITGATGLIGREVGKQLAFAGHRLHAVSRRPDAARRSLPFPATVFAWRGGAADFPAAALAGVEAVIHLAGEPVAAGRWTRARKRAIRDSRVLGTASLVRAIEGGAAPALATFVHGTAIGVYGDRGDEAVDEQAAPASDFLARVVVEWEAAVEPLVRSGVRVVTLRTGVVLSRQGGALEKMLPVFARGVGGRLGSGRQFLSFIHLHDLVRAIAFALDNPAARGVVNGTAPHPLTNADFSRELARALGRPLFAPVPRALLSLAMGEAASVVLASQRVLPSRLQALGFEFTYPTLDGALEELCAPLRGGLRELVAEQWVPHPPAALFPFFCDEKNLERLTPPFLGFRVVGKSTPEVGEGTLIDYRLRLHGIPMRWRSVIESWDPPRRFGDRQLRGPYRTWHHTHDLVAMAGGTLLRDRVLYKVPLGLVGDVLGGGMVTRHVNEIFRFRRRVIDDLFGDSGNSGNSGEAGNSGKAGDPAAPA